MTFEIVEEWVLILIPLFLVWAFVVVDIVRQTGLSIRVKWIWVPLVTIVWLGRKDGIAGDEEIERVLDDLDLESPSEINIRVEGLRTFAGLIGTVVGSQMLVEGAVDLADRAGISSRNGCPAAMSSATRK